jgi:cysteine desulfurase
MQGDENMNEIYLDQSATSRPKQEVVEAMLPYLTDKYYNPSSLYSPAVKVKQDIENARKIIADFIEAEPEEIIFESSATEANNHVVRGWDDVHIGNKSVIITTPIEHKSIMMALENPILHSNVCYCNVDDKGFVDLNHLHKLIKKHSDYDILVSIGAANSEVGTVQDIKAIGRLVRKYSNAVFHTDATQLLPYHKVDVNDMHIDMLSSSAQKFGGAKGVGFLYKKKSVELAPLIWGAQESGLRGSTENVAGIIGMAKAVELTEIGMKDVGAMATVRDYLLYKLKKIGCSVNGSEESRLPNNANVILPDGVGGEEALYLLDMCNIFISVGSACSSTSKEPSYVLKSIGLTDDEAMRTSRITINQDTTINDVDNVIAELEKCIKLLGENM